MLKKIIGRGPGAPAAPYGNRRVSAQELSAEIDSLIDEKPGALFGPTSTPYLAYENLAGLMDRSTRIIPTFLAMVVLPSLIVLAYLAFFSTPQFESEQSFTVQQGTKSQRSMSGVMALAAQVSGFSTNNQETYMVLEYLRSASVIEDIGGASFLEGVFAHDGIDPLSRMEKGLPVEEIKKYWNDKIIPELDTRSGIINLKVRAFSSDEAFAISRHLAQLSEDLVNKVSLRSRNATLERVETDVQRSVGLLTETRDALLAFRVAEGSIDPVQDAQEIGKVVTELTVQKIQVETELGALRKQVAPDSPMLNVKREQVNALERQIKAAEDRLTGMAQANASIAEKLVQYEKLKTDLEYYEKLYSISLSTYEQARADTIKQQIFVIPVVEPQVAQSSSYPNKFEVTVSVFLLCFGLWSIAALMIAAIKDHRV